MEFVKQDLIEATENGDVAMAEKPIVRCNDNSSVGTMSDKKNDLSTRRQLKRKAELSLRSESNTVKKYKTLVESHLHKAVRDANLKLDSKILATVPDIDIKNIAGETALHLAVESGYLTIARLLLNKNANVNALDRSSLSPLHYAIIVGDGKMTELLLDYGPRDGAEYPDEKSLMFKAIVTGNAKKVEQLLNSGASIDSPSCWNELEGYTALHYAVLFNYEEIVKLLLSKGADVNTRVNPSTPLHLAVANKRDEIVKILLKQDGIDVRAEDHRGKTVLNIAIEQFDASNIKEIMKFYPNVENKDLRRLFYGDSYTGGLYCAGGTEELISPIDEIVFSHGFTIYPEDARDGSFLHAVVDRGSSRILKILLQYGADVNCPHVDREDHTLLHHAAHKGQFSVARMLIEHGADVNALDENKKLPITYAIENVDLKMTELLVSSGAKIMYPWESIKSFTNINVWKIIKCLIDNDSGIDINGTDKFGQTAMYNIVNKRTCAPSVGNLSIGSQNIYGLIRDLAETLLSRGANIEKQSPYDWSPLHCAVHSNDEKLVEILLKYNADVDVKGFTNISAPLHLAAMQGNVRVTRMLIAAGASIDPKNGYGKSPLRLACERKEVRVAATLLECGARIDIIDNCDTTQLHVAAMDRTLVIVETLLNAFADVEWTNVKTALRVAVELGDHNIVEELLNYGADINGIRERDHLSSENESYAGNYRSIVDSILSRCIYGSHSFNKVIKQHILKLKSLNMYLDRRYIELLNSDKEFEDFQIICEREVELMKREKLCGTNISYYGILMKSADQMAILTRNKSIAYNVECFNRDERFITYRKMLYYHFKKGQDRGNLLSASFKRFNFLSGFALPELVSQKVLNYLSNRDLKNLIETDPDNDSE